MNCAQIKIEKLGRSVQKLGQGVSGGYVKTVVHVHEQCQVHLLVLQHKGLSMRLFAEYTNFSFNDGTTPKPSS